MQKIISKSNFNEILRIINSGISHNTDRMPLGRQNYLVFWFSPIQEAKVLDQSDYLVIHIFPSNLGRNIGYSKLIF